MRCILNTMLLAGLVSLTMAEDSVLDKAKNALGDAKNAATGKEAANSAATGKEAANATARKELTKIFAAHPKFRELFAKAVAEKPDLMNEFVEFLAAKESHGVKDFIERKGSEAQPISAMCADYSVRLTAVEKWAHDNSAGATALAKTKDGLKNVLVDAEALAKEEHKAKKH